MPKKNEETTEVNITDLPGVGAATAEKLESAGMGTVLSIAVSHPSTLEEITGMSEAVARKLIKAARDSMGFGFIDGLETETTQNAKGFKISTGALEFDKIIGGGVPSGGITEIFGEWASGKSQIAHQLAVNAIKQYPDGFVIYLDTEGTFTPERIRQMSKGAGLDPDTTLKQIRVAKVFNSDHQVFMAEQIEGLLKRKDKIVLVIVDSLIALFRAEYTGRGRLADRQQKINKHLRTLQKIADLYDVPVMVTNQVSSNPGVVYGNPTQAVGGNIVAHNMLVRVYVRKGSKGTRVAKLLDSTFMPEAECSYIITENGIEDAE